MLECFLEIPHYCLPSSIVTPRILITVWTGSQLLLALVQVLPRRDEDRVESDNLQYMQPVEEPHAVIGLTTARAENAIAVDERASKSKARDEGKVAFLQACCEVFVIASLAVTVLDGVFVGQVVFYRDLRVQCFCCFCIDSVARPQDLGTSVLSRSELDDVGPLHLAAFEGRLVAAWVVQRRCMEQALIDETSDFRWYAQ